MYSLREVFKTETGQRVSNQFLGTRYSYVHKETNYADWSNFFKSTFDCDPVTTKDACRASDLSIDCIAFVVDEEGRCYPLYKDTYCYIVMPNGQTFERLLT